MSGCLSLPTEYYVVKLNTTWKFTVQGTIQFRRVEQITSFYKDCLQKFLVTKPEISSSCKNEIRYEVREEVEVAFRTRDKFIITPILGN